MPFPKITHCLICEGVRQEQGKKQTILGFFGITPNVRILLHHPDQPLDQLTFFLVGGIGEGEYKLSFRLIDDAGKTIFGPKEPLSVGFTNAGPQSQFIIHAGPIKFLRLGEYHFELIVDGQVHFRTSLQVDAAKKEDLE